MIDFGSSAQLFSVAWDNLIHTIIAVIVVLPLALAHRADALKLIVMAAALGSLIDLDHFVAAGSLSLPAATTLPARPPAHSLTFAAVVAVASLAITKANGMLAWTIFASLSSHILRDASSGATQLLYPLGVYTIPSWLYAAGELLLFTSSLFLARQRWLPLMRSRPTGTRTDLTTPRAEASSERAHSHHPH